MAVPIPIQISYAKQHSTRNLKKSTLLFWRTEIIFKWEIIYVGFVQKFLKNPIHLCL